MRYYIDFDNTLCTTFERDYVHSQPIMERIERVRKLKEEGHTIVIWTGRGSESKIDYRNLTENQLKEWNIPYDELLLGKPCYDCYIDDKSYHVDEYWPCKKGLSRKEKVEKVEKGWGYEIIFVNDLEYCGKILHFEKGKKFSMHYHIEKKETWYVASGEFLFYWIDTRNGIMYTEKLRVGDTITNERGQPHQLEAIECGDIYEVSTMHKDSDSYRIWRGD
jgi:mannose-6-phosphate isomerase-like protein (cupin superfamily)